MCLWLASSSTKSVTVCISMIFPPVGWLSGNYGLSFSDVQCLPLSDISNPCGHFVRSRCRSLTLTRSHLQYAPLYGTCGSLCGVCNSMNSQTACWFACLTVCLCAVCLNSNYILLWIGSRTVFTWANFVVFSVDWLVVTEDGHLSSGQLWFGLVTEWRMIEVIDSSKIQWFLFFCCWFMLFLNRLVNIRHLILRSWSRQICIEIIFIFVDIDNDSVIIGGWAGLMFPSIRFSENEAFHPKWFMAPLCKYGENFLFCSSSFGIKCHVVRYPFCRIQF